MQLWHCLLQFWPQPSFTTLALLTLPECDMYAWPEFLFLLIMFLFQLDSSQTFFLPRFWILVKLILSESAGWKCAVIKIILSSIIGQCQTSSICSETRGQWSDRSAVSDRKTLSPPGPMSYLCGLTLRIWTSFWRREDANGMDMWNAPMVQRQPLTYRLMEIVGLGGPRWHGNSWQRGIAESGSSRPSTLMIDIPGDLVWDLPCVQQASYLQGGPLVWMLPLYLHVYQKSDYDMMIHQAESWDHLALDCCWSNCARFAACLCFEKKGHLALK